MIIDEILKFDDLNKEAEVIQDPEKAAEIIKRYEDIIKKRFLKDLTKGKVC